LVIFFFFSLVVCFFFVCGRSAVWGGGGGAPPPPQLVVNVNVQYPTAELRHVAAARLLPGCFWHWLQHRMQFLSAKYNGNLATQAQQQSRAPRRGRALLRHPRAHKVVLRPVQPLAALVTVAHGPARTAQPQLPVPAARLAACGTHRRLL
jgi:hypothetical protein